MNTIPRELIVFDIDGTLTDSVALHQEAFHQALLQTGATQFDHHFNTYLHHTDLHIAKVIIEATTTLLFNEAEVDRFEQRLMNGFNGGTIAEIGGARTAVTLLQQAGYAICYATGSLYLPAVHKLRSIGIDFHPLQLVAANRLEEREAIVAQAIGQAKQHYAVEAFERMTLYGDGLWDLKTAQHLGLDFVGIGAKHKELLLQHGMTRHLDDFLDFCPDTQE